MKKDIVAWAVICKDGDFHTIRRYKYDANDDISRLDKAWGCGPHVLAKLDGVIEIQQTVKR